MALKFQLSHPMLGTRTLNVADPIDINTLRKTTKRSENQDGVFYEVMVDVKFIKDGRRYIQAGYETQGGIDCDIRVRIYDYDVNNRKWVLWFTGKVNFNKYDIEEDNVVIIIDQTDIQTRVLNLMEQEVDLDTVVSENGLALPAQVIREIPFHSKVLQKESLTEATNGDEFQQLDAGTISLPPTGATDDLDLIWYGQFDNGKTEVEELEQMFDTPYGWEMYINAPPTQQIPGAGTIGKYITFLSARKEFRNPRYVATEKGTMKVVSNLRYKFQVDADNTGGDIDVNGGSGCLGHVEVYAWYEHRDEFDNIKTIENAGIWTVSPTGSDHAESAFELKNFIKENVVVEVGDKFYIYHTFRIWGAYEAPGILGSAGQVHHDLKIQADEEVTFFDFVSQTVAEPSIIRGILIYEAIERCIQYYTNQVDVFKSDLLGRVDIGYAVDGKGSLVSIQNGSRVRGDDDARQFNSLKDLLEFVNAVHCIGYGFETINGKVKFVVEEKAHFFNKNVTSVSLGSVYNIRKRVDPKRYYNKFTYGYSTKVDLRSVNGRDAFNTLRKNSLPIVNTKNELNVSTKMVTEGLIIETQRRLFESPSTDSIYDDSTFAVCVIRDGIGFKSHSNEGFAEIENVLNPETGYNYLITPARCLRNWLTSLSSGLIKSPNKTVKFIFGEKNFILRTRKDDEFEVVDESGDVTVVNVEPIWHNEVYDLTAVPVTRSQMKLIEANPYAVIEAQDLFGQKIEGFINHERGIEYDINADQADFELLRVFRPN
jgi:hypothetical protein